MLNLLQSTLASIDESELLGIQTLADPVMTTSQDLTELALRFFLNLLSCWIIVRLLYYPKSRRRDYLFTFTAFSSAMLLLLYIMGRVDVGVGLTLGLFAIFGIIRYRTETVPVREMTYLFVIIAVAVINGLALNISYAELVIANLLMVALLALLERRHKGDLSTKIVLYDRIANIVPEKRAELIADLEQRLGVKVEDLEIGSVDFLKDSAWIKVRYHLEKGAVNSIDHITRERDFNNN